MAENSLTASMDFYHDVRTPNEITGESRSE